MHKTLTARRARATDTAAARPRRNNDDNNIIIINRSHALAAAAARTKNGISRLRNTRIVIVQYFIHALYRYIANDTRAAAALTGVEVLKASAGRYCVLGLWLSKGLKRNVHAPFLDCYIKISRIPDSFVSVPCNIKSVLLLNPSLLL